MTSDSRVLPPLPVPDELTKPFWEAANQGRLVIQRCREFSDPGCYPSPSGTAGRTGADRQSRNR